MRVLGIRLNCSVHNGVLLHCVIPTQLLPRAPSSTASLAAVPAHHTATGQRLGRKMHGVAGSTGVMVLPSHASVCGRPGTAHTDVFA